LPAIGAAKGIKQLAKGAAVGQAGQFIPISHVIRISNNVRTHIQAAGHQENFPTMFDRQDITQNQSAERSGKSLGNRSLIEPDQNNAA
jgi:hypothetical protein